MRQLTRGHVFVLSLALVIVGVIGWRAFSAGESPPKTRARSADLPFQAQPDRAPRALPRKATAQVPAVASALNDTQVNGGAADEADKISDVTTAVGASDSKKKSAPARVEQLHLTVLQEAVRKDWISVNEQGSPCPPEQLRILYGAPGDLSKYTRGAYFDPLGPEPSESTLEVNGLLICEGYTHVYRGFEAYYRPERDQWDVFPFPVIE